MSGIIENEEIEFPLNEEIIIEIVDLRYAKKSLVVEAIYEDILFTFNVFWTNKFCSADNKFSFKILDEDKQLAVPDNFKLIAKFDVTKSGYLKCLSARILDE
ncbi:hypothetical protein [Aliarcobacter cryaerophilus]|uniref:hypothetical protein n=1 Tax=Aliarcobacter cryaerophilus TaxID=28198 RepID=UPI0011DF6430|nr:hypothetical protein [Aliarcobacter cryaerophilus]